MEIGQWSMGQWVTKDDQFLSLTGSK